MASTRNGLDALAGHNFSDGDLRASASPWSFRRQRQRQAASNYAVMLGRLTAIEEQRGLLAARHADFVKQFEFQIDIFTDLRVNMPEKIYVFLDWQKIGSLVNGRMPHVTMHTAADSSMLRMPPPDPCQPEPEMSPMKDVVPDDAGTFLAMRQNGRAATELFDIFDSCSHVAVQTDGTGDIAKEEDFKLTGSSDGATSSIGTNDGEKNKNRTKQVKCTKEKSHSFNAEKTAAVTAAADAGEGKKEKLEDIVIGIEENENERNDEDDEEYNEEENNEEEDNEEQDSEEEAKEGEDNVCDFRDEIPINDDKKNLQREEEEDAELYDAMQSYSKQSQKTDVKVYTGWCEKHAPHREAIQTTALPRAVRRNASMDETFLAELFF